MSSTDIRLQKTLHIYCVREYLPGGIHRATKNIPGTGSLPRKTTTSASPWTKRTSPLVHVACRATVKQGWSMLLTIVPGVTGTKRRNDMTTIGQSIRGGPSCRGSVRARRATQGVLPRARSTAIHAVLQALSMIVA